VKYHFGVYCYQPSWELPFMMQDGRDRCPGWIWVNPSKTFKNLVTWLQNEEISILNKHNSTGASQ
jgi:hypothetical protein